MNPAKILTLGVAVASLLGGTLSAQSIEGTYQCKGSGPNGVNAYSGSATITKDASVYPIQWDLGSIGSYAGTGILSGDVLAAAYGGGQPYGLVVYKINGGKLSGQWTIGGQKTVGEENLEGPDGLSGTYTITSAKSSEGVPYAGKVTITKNGGIFLITWNLEKETYSGVGILHGNLLVAGWGLGEDYGVVAYSLRDGSLSGKWAAGKMDTLGSETLTK